jgi:predicted O-methyltransferase YrrM
MARTRSGENMETIQNRLYESSPYQGFAGDAYPQDVQGWGSDDPILSEIIMAIRPRRIAEIGSWKGRSAINMARAVKSVGVECEIVCIDTWLGSPEHWDRIAHPDWYDSLRLRHGYPHLYYTFLANVARAGFEDIITPFPSASANAAVLFRRWGITFDFCYIDGAHEYQSVCRDLIDYWDLLGSDGVMLGDDYMIWPGVTQAANDFAKHKNTQIYSKPGKFLMQKGNRLTIATG